MEAEDRSDESNEDEEESRFREAEHWGEDQDRKVSPEEDQVTIVNNASSDIPTNPFSQPRVWSLQFPTLTTKTI
ncbi:hypothetical protein HOY80DRAFT_1038114 [Tuber brumale]|nr:hypothetical protein HOY80DRAFT_1038114 [Tuber brumale]